MSLELIRVGLLVVFGNRHTTRNRLFQYIITYHLKYIQFYENY